MGEQDKGWLPIVLMPTDGVARVLLLPDGTETIGSYQNGGLGKQQGWEIRSPHEYDEPVYEYEPRMGFIADPTKMHHSSPDPERKQVGTRKATMWVIGRLKDGVYPTHFRPNDTVYGAPTA